MRRSALWQHFRPSGFSVLRTPALPFDDFIAWGAGLQQARVARSQVDPAATTGGVHEDSNELRKRLLRIVSRPEVREALFIASPDLVRSIDAWAQNPETPTSRRTERAVARYFARMTGRPTPFGLFAGFTVGTTGPHTALQIAARERQQRTTSIDPEILLRFRDTLRQNREIGEGTCFRPNSTAHLTPNHIKYVEEFQQGGQRRYRLSAVDTSPYLLTLLDAAAGGKTRRDLAGILLSTYDDLAPMDVGDFIDELILSQVLIGPAVPATADHPAVSILVESLQRTSCPDQVISPLRAVTEALVDLDTQTNTGPRSYSGLIAALQQVAPRSERAFYVDLFKPAEDVVIGEGPMNDVLRAVEVMHCLFGGDVGDLLATFRVAFTARYEQEEVSLLDALDEDIGIGFERTMGVAPTVLVEADAAEHTTEPETRWQLRDMILLERVVAASRTGAHEILLSDRDIEKCGNGKLLPLPDAFAVRASIIAISDSAVNAGEYRILFDAMAGPSGARLFGRACHASGELDKAVREHVAAEEQLRPDAVYAEVVHVPPGRGKITSRPVLREYEIPYHSDSGAPVERQLSLSDLFVSVRGDTIVLRSRRLGREVIPRLTSAHAFTEAGLGLYRFLCLLQIQGVVPSLTWKWGPLEALPFLPRVVYRNVILTRARWNVPKEELDALVDARGDVSFVAVQEWRARNCMPRLLEFVESDNTLPIDLDNVCSVDAFLAVARKKDQILLAEMVSGVDSLCAQGPEGRFMHEVLLPFVRRPGAADELPECKPTLVVAGNDRVLANTREVVKRRFPPGSEWLYLKVYAGPFQAEQCLREIIGPLVRAAEESGMIDRWFFVRYGDPDWHVRVRLHGLADSLLADLLPSFRAAIEGSLDNGLIARVQADTYIREVERYGGPAAISGAESVFHADSRAVLALLDNLHSSGAAESNAVDATFWLALHSADRLLSDFDFSVPERISLYSQLQSALGHEFGVKRTRRQFSGAFRRHRMTIEAAVDTPPLPECAVQLADAALCRRSTTVRGVADELRKMAGNGKLTAPLPTIVAAFMHMHVNRLIRAGGRRQELAIYHMLLRAYEAKLARSERPGSSVAGSI